MNPSVKSCLKKYLLRFGLGLVAYGFGLVAYNSLFDKLGAFKWALFLLPALPIIYVVTVLIRSVNEMDEMIRKITIEGMAFAGLATGFTCFSFLFASDLSGKSIPIEWAFYLMWFYYGIGSFIASRRHY